MSASPDAGAPPEDPRPPVVMTLPAEPGSLAVVRQVATGVATAAGLGEEAVQDVKVAVTEACTNAVRHAYPGGPDGVVVLAAWTTADRLVLSVRDRGVGLSGDEDVADGVGLVTIAALAAEVGVRAYEGHGTEIIMEFPLRSP